MDLGDLGTVTGENRYSSPTSINDSQQVVGNGLTTMGQWHAFIWDSQRGIEDISVAAGDPSVYEVYTEVDTGPINNAQQVAGTTSPITGDSSAFIWVRGQQPLQLIAAKAPPGITTIVTILGTLLAIAVGTVIFASITGGLVPFPPR